MSHPFTTALIVAGGRGTRMGTELPKQFLPIAGEPMLVHTVRAFYIACCIDAIVCVVPGEHLALARRILGELHLTKPWYVAEGGETRQESVGCGVRYMPTETAYVAIHDGARCLITPRGIDMVVREAHRCHAAIAASPTVNTIKRFDALGLVDTPDRDTLLSAETPQVFSASILMQALQTAKESGAVYTDDSAMVMAIGEKVKPVFLHQENRKITHPDDLTYAEFVLNGKTQRKEICEGMRIGHGYDVHRLVADRPLIIGGISVPHTCGLLGHSDADVLIHAIMDAILGAAALGDIGNLFPDTDPAYKGANSLVLLEHVRSLIARQGYSVGNIDATVVAQAPKLAPYIPHMREKIAAVLHIPSSQINVKATTEEHLGFTGNGEGIAAHAVCVLY